MTFFSRPHTPPFVDEAGNRIETSVATMERVQLHGTWQWIYVRGRDAERPVLLFLHGGPGTAATGLVRRFIPALEERFVVVHWDQRGAAKSFSAGHRKADFTTAQMIEDVGALSAMLHGRYHGEKLLLLGVSWGSYLGVEAVKRWPQHYAAYIGSGQVVFQQLGERISYDFALEQARNHGDETAVRTLLEIGRPPYPQGKHVRYLMKQRRVLAKYGGAFRSETVARQFAEMSLLWNTEEYGLLDKINWVRGQLRSEKILGPAFRAVDFRATASALEVPVYFAQGAHDMQTPTALVREYFEILRAPHKELRTFPHSAHLPMVEEKEAFLGFLNEISARHASSR